MNKHPNIDCSRCGGQHEAGDCPATSPPTGPASGSPILQAISPETHKLVSDIAFRIHDELEREYVATPASDGLVRVRGDLAAYYVSAMLRNEGFRQAFDGIQKSMDAAEVSFRKSEQRGHRSALRRGIATILK